MRISQKNVVSSIFVACLIVSCSPSAQQIETAIAQTQAALPTATLEPTATPKPVTGADLEPLLYKAGDLPTEYALGQFIMDQPEEWPKPDIFRGVSFDYAEYRNLLSARSFVGVFSESSEDRSFASLEGFSGSPVDGLGDVSRLSDEPIDLFAGLYGWSVYDVKIAWARCSYVAEVWSQTPERSATVLTYARRLDERLAEVLCP